MIDVSYTMAFAAGIISFLSPCVLPLVPGYISFISGDSIARETDENGDIVSRKREISTIFLNSLFFVGGFTVIFVLLGATATWAGALISSQINILTKIAGLVIIFFGLFKMGLIPFFFFYREATFHMRNRRFGLAGGFLIGAAFAFGWTPCIGPVLGGILTYAGTLQKINQGVVLLLIYSLGLGIPFLLTTLGINQFFKFFDAIKKHLGLIEKISGAIMVLLGGLIFFDKLTLIPGYLSFMNRFSL